jgi:UDP-N-acetylmuramoylalanine-D-glutamate ligase
MSAEELDSRTQQAIPASLQDKIRTTTVVPNYDDLQDFDLVVLSPGVPLQHRLSVQATALDIPVTSELSFAAAMLPKSVELVCVTGTNGKSTTTTFLAQVLQTHLDPVSG